MKNFAFYFLDGFGNRYLDQIVTVPKQTSRDYINFSLNIAICQIGAIIEHSLAKLFHTGRYGCAGYRAVPTKSSSANALHTVFNGKVFDSITAIECINANTFYVSRNGQGSKVTIVIKSIRPYLLQCLRKNNLLQITKRKSAKADFGQTFREIAGLELPAMVKGVFANLLQRAGQAYAFQLLGIRKEFVSHAGNAFLNPHRFYQPLKAPHRRSNAVPVVVNRPAAGNRENSHAVQEIPGVWPAQPLAGFGPGRKPGGAHAPQQGQYHQKRYDSLFHFYPPSLLWIL